MITVAVIVVLAVTLYFYGTRNHDYWKKKGVVHLRPVPLFGTEARRMLQRCSLAQSAAAAYWRFPGERFVGRYRSCTPELLIRDPDLVRTILVTDFKYFHARGLTPSHKWHEPLLRNLFFADGDLWRLLRQRMTPAFTSGKLKAMFPLIVERAERLQVRALAAAAAARPIDARDLMARYTTDFIGACGFGLDADSLNDDDSAFRKLGAKILNPTLKRTVVSICKVMFPDAFKYFKFLGQDLEDDIVRLTTQIRAQRGFEPSGRGDFLDFLMEWQARGKVAVQSIDSGDGRPETVAIELDDAMLAAQAFIFFVAGFETSSSATSFTLHQLALNPEAQERARASVDAALARHGGRLCYDAVKEMTYLEWAFLEGMRMFPSSGCLLRECVRRYTLPGTAVELDPGVKVTVPLTALHNDPTYFPEPERFRPERFSPEEAAGRHKFAYLPFGEGPRACIGGRLGALQSMAGLAAVLAACEVLPAPQTRAVLRPDPRSTIVQAVLGGVPLTLGRRKAPPVASPA